ncbi:hypothetical protein E2C01_064507 [Portunus trituberculatus]|uniref:Uncharacterized protein n=1 Tax=Portunus trituberculatus TaxID=210409 RepID=A0A5B7HL10_PORTR|nr:hypothetical protein [Portunus trituberculatus]
MYRIVVGVLKSLEIPGKGKTKTEKHVASFMFYFHLSGGNNLKEVSQSTLPARLMHRPLEGGSVEMKWQKSLKDTAVEVEVGAS